MKLISKNTEASRVRNRNFRLRNPKKQMYHQAKYRAKKRGLEFDITPDDVPDIPLHCPILGIELKYIFRGRGGWYDDSPSLDRVDPNKGYVKGNLQIISNRANRLKVDASLDELRKVVAYLESV